MSQRIAQIEDKIDHILATLEVPEYVGVSFLAKKLGVSEQHLRNHPWLLPDWGRSEIPGRILWSRKTVRIWLDEATPAERDRQWQRLSPSEKASFLRRRAG